MDVKAPDEGQYGFGPFILNPRERSLLRNGQPVPITNRVFETLLVFVRNPGRVLSKDELLEAVWPGRLMEESSLKQAISTLRRTLSGETDPKRYLVTVGGRGYQFVAKIDNLKSDFDQSARRDLHTPATGSPTSNSASIAPLLQTASRIGRATAPLQRPALDQLVWSVAAALILAAGVLLLPLVRSWLDVPNRADDSLRPPPRSIAVLAFANMSGDPRQEYLSDGLSEELINALSRVDALRVAARTSTFYFKTHPATAADIAHRLNVAAVLEGSVRRDGSRLRITAQLINGNTGFEMWSHGYDRNFSEIPKLETEIATDVTRSLQPTLKAEDTARLTMGSTANALAFDAFLQGVRAMNGRDETSYRSALGAFDEAIRLDPRYGAAQARRAIVLMFIADIGATNDPSRVRGLLAEAMAGADRAINLAPDWGVAHATKGAILLALLDFAGAERELSKARALAPDDAAVDRPYGYLEACLGRRAVAEEAAARVVARFPADAYGYADQAQILYLGRRYEDSLAAFRHARALNEIMAPTDQLIVALDYLALGKPEVSRNSCPVQGSWQQTLCLAIVSHRLGRPAEADAYLASLRARMGDQDAYQYAEAYAQWGDRARALQSLNTAYRLRDPGLVMLRADPLLDPVRGRPEFAGIERALDFPP